MKYLLLYKIDELSKKVLLKSYLADGFEIIADTYDIILIRKNNKSIIDEEVYIKVLYSYLKRSELIKGSKGKIIDLTKAFKYADSKNGYNRFDNNFEWYIRNIIVKEIINDSFYDKQ